MVYGGCDGRSALRIPCAIARAGSFSANLEDVRKQIDTKPYRKQFAGDDPHYQEPFDESIEGLIRNAFCQAPK